MASAEILSAHDIQKAIEDRGFFLVKDAVIGQNIQEMENDKTPYASARGLGFFKINVLNNSCIRPVLDAFFKWFGLGLYRSTGAAPNDYTFRKSDPKADGECLIVHLWRKGSRVSFWEGSHRHQLPSVKGDNNLWRVPRIHLTRLGLNPTDITFEKGGFAIVDPRVVITITAGDAITFAFGTKEVTNTAWTPMLLPWSLKQTVTDMESENFGMNVTYSGQREGT